MDRIHCSSIDSFSQISRKQRESDGLHAKKKNCSIIRLKIIKIVDANFFKSIELQRLPLSSSEIRRCEGTLGVKKRAKWDRRTRGERE